MRVLERGASYARPHETAASLTHCLSGSCCSSLLREVLACDLQHTLNNVHLGFRLDIL